MERASALMRSAALAGLLLSAILCSGCLVVSLHPLYEEGALEFDEALVGEWEGVEERAAVRVERGEWRSYKVTYTAGDRSVVLLGFLTRIGNSRVLDLTPCRLADADALLLPSHAALRVQVLGDSLTVAPLDYDWFVDGMERDRLATLRPALDARRNVVLTAGTAALRRWLMGSPIDNRFGDSIRLTRRPS